MKVDGPPPSGPRRGTWATKAIRLAFTVGVTWLILDRVGISIGDALSISDAVPDPSLGLLTASVALLFAGFGVSAWLWGLMVTEFGAEPPGLMVSLRVVLTANLGRYLPGKLWQIAGLAVLAKRRGIGAGVATTAAVVGQGFSLVAAAVVGAPMLLGQELGDPRTASVALGVLLLAVLVGSVPAVLRRAVSLAIRVTRGDASAVPSIRASFGPRWLGLYVIGWFFYGGAFVLFVRGLGLDGGMVELVSGFSAAYLMGYVAIFAPAGIGVREGFLVAFLEPAVGPGVMTLAVLTRVWMTAVEVLPAAGLALSEMGRPPIASGARVGVGAGDP